jgi:hypothetical protein
MTWIVELTRNESDPKCWHRWNDKEYSKADAEAIAAELNKSIAALMNRNTIEKKYYAASQYKARAIELVKPPASAQPEQSPPAAEPSVLEIMRKHKKK